MNALHNRLIDMFDAATHKDLVDDAAFTYLQDLEGFIRLWAVALKHAMAGDKKEAREFLEFAFKLANRSDQRKKFLRRGVETPFVRYHELL